MVNRSIHLGTSWGGPAGTVLNSSDKSANVNLTGGLTATTTSGQAGGVRSNVSHSTGKFFFSMHHDTSAPSSYDTGLGLVDGTTTTLDFATIFGVLNFNGDAHFYIYSPTQAGHGISVTDTGVSGVVIDVAVDLDAKLIWIRKDNGDWNTSGGNPATAAGGDDWSAASGSGPWFVGVYINTGSPTVTMNFGATAYTYAAPSGFGNW